MLYTIDGIIGVNFYETHDVPRWAPGQVFKTSNNGEAIYAKADIGCAQYDLVGLYQNLSDENWYSRPTLFEIFEGPTLQVGVALVEVPVGNYGFFIVKGSDETLKINCAANTSWNFEYKVFTSPTAGVLQTALASSPPANEAALSGLVVLENGPTEAAPLRAQLLYPQANAY